MSTVWFVESRVNEQFDGWLTGVPKGTGGWITTDPLQAKRYTDAEANAVAAALDYFPAPFPYSHWIATEHEFLPNEYSCTTCGKLIPVPNNYCSANCANGAEFERKLP